MNEEANELALRMRDVFLNGTWIANTNFRDQLGKVDYVLANRKYESLNSITLLTQHIHYYVKGIEEAFETGQLDIRDRFSFDFPPVSDETSWTQVIAHFIEDSEKLIQRVANWSEAELKGPFTDPKYGTCQRNIEALIEHAYYHLGQIVLIRKLLEITV